MRNNKYLLLITCLLFIFIKTAYGQSADTMELVIENQGDHIMRITQNPIGCAHWDNAQEITLLPLSSITFTINDGACIGQGPFIFSNQFSVQEKNSELKDIAYFKFECSSDAGGCSANQEGFPLQLNKNTKVCFRDTGKVGPFTLQLYTQKCASEN